jgi:predicted metallo-beta-lactamase superfamily hydrolase
MKQTKVMFVDSDEKINKSKASKALKLAKSQEETHYWVTSADGKTRTLKKREYGN